MKIDWITKRRFFLILLVPLLIAIGYASYMKYKESTMPPLVFLIPDDYFGPVFFLFGQPDGVELQKDPLGNAVRVPVNGIVKLKEPMSNVVASSSGQPGGRRVIYMVSVSPSNDRKILKYDVGVRQDDDGTWWTGYFDEDARLHRVSFDHTTLKQPPVFLYPESTRNEKFIFQDDTCAHQFGELNGPAEKVVACGKFLVATPNQLVGLPDFMWREFEHPFTSIGQLVEQADAAMSEKRKYYKLP